MTALRIGIALLFISSMYGCGKAKDNSTNKHPAGWAVATSGGSHPVAYISNPNGCKECHGTDMKGGISKVSCFSATRSGISCHAQGPVGHPAGWGLSSAHGAHAKASAVAPDGMLACAGCHGSDYRGGGVSQKDCLRCHTSAPHPPKPWFGGPTHRDTHPNNAPACLQCHANRNNLSSTGLDRIQSRQVDGVGASGCFNNSMCHSFIGHPFPNPGATHRGIGFEEFNLCGTCHEYLGSAGTYPVAYGTPPVCSGCHLGWTLGSNRDSSCEACHGTRNKIPGAPTGTNFPDYAGSHATHLTSPLLSGITCEVCHFGGGSGAVSHGNSNRVLKTANDVVVIFSSAGGTMNATSSYVPSTNRLSVTCTGMCHEQHDSRSW